ncbi:hypothetical protein ABT294_31030 [Nonomuraea sp. NPDC000554]|uniref:hypothetical protein n=1 Tax=Nonomuraea sp. NPDC000554 TaxID=3154259 RepID=UPI0033308FFE
MTRSLVEIRDVRVVADSPELVVATYTEWQHERGRRATVVLRRQGDGLGWLHLHETWMVNSDDNLEQAGGI